MTDRHKTSSLTHVQRSIPNRLVWGSMAEKLRTLVDGQIPGYGPSVTKQQRMCWRVSRALPAMCIAGLGVWFTAQYGAS